MSHDTRFPTSYDREPLRYTPFFQEVHDITNRQFSRSMLASAKDYEDYSRAAEAVAKRAFPDTESAAGETTPTKYYVAELRSSQGMVTFKQGFLLAIELSKEDGLFFFENSRFNLFGSGPTKEDALKDLSEFFVHDYLSYKNTPSEKLTQDARQLLQDYDSIINEFETA